MRIQKIIALCSMMLLSGATTLGANAQQIMQIQKTEVIKPSSILTPGDNVVLITKTQSAVIPATNVTADIHTPSLLPPGTLMVRSAVGCDTAIILPGMADMPAAQVADVLQVNSTAAVVPAVKTEEVAPTITTKKVNVYRQVRTTTVKKKIARKGCATKRAKRSCAKRSSYAPACGS
jgi:hypothetical protein